MARFAVVCADGMGDALIMHIASYSLRQKGHQVVTFSNHLHLFGKWLPDFEFQTQPHSLESFKDFDAILLQHDNTEKALSILTLHPQIPVYTFHTNYRPGKHGPLRTWYDFPFDQNLTMVSNVKTAIQSLFYIDTCEGKNGLTPPTGLTYRKYPKRVAIHPTSTSETRNWTKEKFLKVARWLKVKGYDPVFVTSPTERSGWDAPLLPKLEDLASFIYESGTFLGNDSGPGHLASYFGLPYLIIGRQVKHMRLWRPGWHEGKIVTPPAWVPDWRNIRNGDWKKFISSNNVINLLKSTVLQIK